MSGAEPWLECIWISLLNYYLREYFQKSCELRIVIFISLMRTLRLGTGVGGDGDRTEHQGM